MAQRKIVSLYRVGTFWYRTRKGRTVTRPHRNNPGEFFTSVQPDSFVIKFKAAQTLKNAINGKTKP